jgi:hypothetical protein
MLAGGVVLDRDLCRGANGLNGSIQRCWQPQTVHLGGSESLMTPGVVTGPEP